MFWNSKYALPVPGWCSCWAYNLGLAAGQASPLPTKPYPKLVSCFLFSVYVLKFILLIYLCVCECVCVVFTEGRRGHQIPRSWSYRLLWSTQHGCLEPNSNPQEEQYCTLTNCTMVLTSSVHKLCDIAFFRKMMTIYYHYVPASVCVWEGCVLMCAHMHVSTKIPDPFVI